MLNLKETSSNEASGTADVPDEDDNRASDGNTLPDDIPAPDDSFTSTSSNTCLSSNNFNRTKFQQHPTN